MRTRTIASNDAPLNLFDLPIVGVMGSGAEAHRELAEPLGLYIAQRGWNLLTGGGGGVMRAVSKGFAEVQHRKGCVIGVIPKDGPMNEYVELPFMTPLTSSEFSESGALTGRSRNHVNIRLSDAVVALPGGAGTWSELCLAVDRGAPCIAFLGAAGAIAGHAGDAEGLEVIGRDRRATVQIARTLEVLSAFLERTLRAAQPPPAA